VYWIETHGGQLLGGPKLIKSCSVYQEEEVHLVGCITKKSVTMHGHMNVKKIATVTAAGEKSLG